MMRASRRTWGLLIALLIASMPALATNNTLVVHAGHLLDVESGKVLDDQAIHIAEGRITAIAAWDADAISATRQLDWSDYTVVPGLILSMTFG